MENIKLLEHLTEEEAIEIYKQGQEAVVFEFLKMAKIICDLQRKLNKISDIKISKKLSTCAVR